MSFLLVLSHFYWFLSHFIDHFYDFFGHQNPSPANNLIFTHFPLVFFLSKFKYLDKFQGVFSSSSAAIDCFSVTSSFMYLEINLFSNGISEFMATNLYFCINNFYQMVSSLEFWFCFNNFSSSNLCPCSKIWTAIAQLTIWCDLIYPSYVCVYILFLSIQYRLYHSLDILCSKFQVFCCL